MRPQNASDVDRFQNTGFSNKNQSAIKKFFENLYEGISRVDWKVSIPSYRFLRNFFIAEIGFDYGQGRIGFRSEAKVFLKGRSFLRQNL